MKENLAATGATKNLRVISGRGPRKRHGCEEHARLNILLVEDNPADADLCTEYLNSAFPGKAVVHHVTRLIQAYSVLTENRVIDMDVVLLDLSLPDAMGLEALVGLRELAPKLPIIVLTGNKNSDLGVAAIRERAEDYCPKSSLNAETLGRIVRHALERHRWRNGYRNLLETSPDGMIVLDSNCNILFANVAARRLLGEDQKLKAGNRFPRPLPGTACKAEIELPDGQVAEIAVVAIEWEGQLARLATLRDITAHKRAEKKLLDLAQVDRLTGLASRAYFMDFLTRRLASLRRSDAALALMFIDLDRFKIINDTLGHGVGDKLLQHAAERFTFCLRQDDFLGRLGGDEFGLILPSIKQPQEAAYVARKLLSVLTAPFHIEGRELTVGASIGIAIYPGCGNNAEELLQAADAAMYRAKQTRNAYHFYSQEMQVAALARIKMEAAVRRASEAEEFMLYFQPQFSISGDRIVALEALLRWNDPDYGHLGPEQFIPVAEDIGLITGIGSWVLRHATARSVEWLQTLKRPIRVAVNISGQQLSQENFPDFVATALVDSRLPPECLELEVTEGAFIDNNKQAVQSLAALRQMGVSAIIDDFGIGYSSLSHLLKLPITGLKLDKRFVYEVGCNAQSEMIIENLIHMAHAVGLTVTAEGVENETQRAFLEQCGCDFGQGTHFGRPLPAAEVVERLHDWPRVPRDPDKPA